MFRKFLILSMTLSLFLLVASAAPDCGKCGTPEAAAKTACCKQACGADCKCDCACCKAVKEG